MNIPESRLLQWKSFLRSMYPKLAKFLFPPKDTDSLPTPSIPMGGSAEEQADSSKDKSSQSEQAESSASGNSSGSSQQDQQQEESGKRTSQADKSDTAPSGSGKEGTPETQQQGSGQDIKGQLAQGQQQTGDTSGTGEKDSKPTDNAGRDYLTSLKNIRYKGKR